MSKAEGVWSMELEELQMHADGSRAYRLGADDVSGFAAESWSANAEEPVSVMDWSAEPDLEDDDLELVPRAVLDVLWSKAEEYDRIMALCVHVLSCACE